MSAVELIIEARGRDLGIPVKRILPAVKRRMVGPFIFLDHMGPAHLRPEVDHLDVRPHPHIGLSTLTYLFSGSLMHRDSLGVQQLIVPGEVNWMTAGKGISHSEREPSSSRHEEREIHGLQFWVALPKDKEDIDPSFFHYKGIPEEVTASSRVVVVAGARNGKESPLAAHSPMTFQVVEAKSEGSFDFDAPNFELAVYVVEGSVAIEETTVKATELAVLKRGAPLRLRHTKDARFAVIGGVPFPEPRHIWWNLVSSDPRKIETAKKAWTEGTFPMVPGDHEKIPLPES